MKRIRKSGRMLSTETFCPGEQPENQNDRVRGNTKPVPQEPQFSRGPQDVPGVQEIVSLFLTEPCRSPTLTSLASV